MTYTAKSRGELIEQVKEYLRRDYLHDKVEDGCQGEYKFMYLLMRKYEPKDTAVAASNEVGETFLFYPFYLCLRSPSLPSSVIYRSFLESGMSQHSQRIQQTMQYTLYPQ